MVTWWTLMTASLLTHPDRDLSVIRNVMSGLPVNHVVMLGQVCQASRWLVSAETSRHASIRSAIRHLALQLLEVEHLAAARIGRSAPVLPGRSEYCA